MSSKAPKLLIAGNEPQVPPVSGRAHLIIGIGASAGGLEAFKAFFAGMPVDTGMSFVLVQHLDPTYDSALVELVAGFTSMPVQSAVHRAPIEPNTVYVIPPNVILSIRLGRLHLSRPATPAARRVSVNTFLISLAEDQGENAVGIILSGFGNDGALGITAIKANGGLTLSEAEFDHHAKSGMPQSAASSGCVDHVLPIDDMAAALQNYQRHRAIYDSTKGPDGIRRDLPNHLAAICSVLHAKLGRDFSQYKSGTLMRRIQRRMHVLQTNEVAAYITQLRMLPQEADFLFREMLIGVTRFFRDPQAFAALQSDVIVPLLSDTMPDAPLRVWVAGCATGEEAYSIAILLKETMAEAGSTRTAQIFATDIDERAIEIARAGAYPATIAADVSAERLKRHFLYENECYRISKEIREMCLFSTHDLTKDPPFSKLDLVSCRNVLIYFEQPLQQRVITLFHYALRQDGHLFLGPSESVASQSRLFRQGNKRFRLFRRQDSPATLPTMALTRGASYVPIGRPPSPQGDDIDRRAARAIAPYAPACLVVDQRYDILRFSGPTSKYIEPVSGIASLHLFNLLRMDLRGPAQLALKRAAATGARVMQEGVPTGTGSESETINLIVEPLFEGGSGGVFALVFQMLTTVVAPSARAHMEGPASDAVTETLQFELRTLKDRLRGVTDELRTSNEELQTTGEEYLSVNEELQSTNEELETSREELQSLNEELQTINGELNQRNESLVRVNSDLSNLFDSTSIATLILDNEMRIRRFTPRLLDIFNVREGDEGRPITDIVTRLTQDWLGEDVRKVLRTLIPVEREVELAEGAAIYLMQVRPYRDLNNVINGAVVTFVDISDRKRNEEAQAQLAAIVASSQDAIISYDLNCVVTSWNTSAENLLGHTRAEAMGQPISGLFKAVQPDDWPRMLARLVAGEQIAHFEGTGTAKSGRAVELSVTVSPVKRPDGTIAGASAVARDISERRAAERKSALLLSELDHRVKNILAIVSAVVTQTAASSPELANFAEKLGGRVRAIAKAHSLLTQTDHGEVSLQKVILTELEPYDRGDGNVTVTGCDVAMTPKAGLGMAMALHELLSNAAKYGALSTAKGHVRIKMDQHDGPDGAMLRLVWSETGGPAVKRPTHRGFGTTLIEQTLVYDFDAVIDRKFLPSGLRCTFVIPLTEEFGHVHAPPPREKMP